MSHPWFENFDWVNLINKKLTPPYNPMIGKWQQNFEEEFLNEKVEDSMVDIDSGIFVGIED